MDESELKLLRELFVVDGEELVVGVEALLLRLEKGDVDRAKTFREIKRLAHNLKGSGQIVNFLGVSSFCHSLENLVLGVESGAVEVKPELIDFLLRCMDTLKADLRILSSNPGANTNHPDLTSQIEAFLKGEVGHPTSAPPSNSTVVAPEVKIAPSSPSLPSTEDYLRIPKKRLDDLFDVFGEQVIHLAGLEYYSQDLLANQDKVLQTIMILKKIGSDLQGQTLALRLVKLKGLMGKLERGVRDVARDTGKEVNIHIEGSEQELDKTIVDKLSDALIHMVRNAVDHGIESGEKRKKRGKPLAGTISIRAFRQSDAFIFEVQDDGGGLDTDVIRAKGIQKGLIREDQKLTTDEIYDLIFHSGFSTRDQVSEISGRGVGMDVVKTTIHEIGGQYKIQSEVGKGTTFTLRVPLSLSLFNGICFELGEKQFVIPTAQVHEIVKVSEVEIRSLENNKIISKVRDDVYKMIDLRQIFKSGNNSSENPDEKEVLLLTKIDSEFISFRVSRVVNIIKVVQKPIPSEIVTCPGAVGVTIFGDGTPTVILDFRLLYEKVA